MMQRKRDYKKMMGWFIIIIMVLSVGGIISSGFYGQDQQQQAYQEYNSYKIYASGLQSQLQIGGRTYSFQYPPWMLENITLPLNVLPWLSKEKVYLGYDPLDTDYNNSFSQQEQFIGAVLYANGIIPQRACTQEEGCPDIPLINCDNAGIIFLSSTENVITSDNNCLIFQAHDASERQKFAERFIYGLLGVMT